MNDLAMNHKASNLILHFGLAKTGTTAIQNILHNNRNRLMEESGILYPGLDPSHFHLQAVFSEHPEMLREIKLLQLPNQSAIAAFVKKYRIMLLEEINEKKPKTIIISSEYFSSMSVCELRSMRFFLESIARNITLFAYVRDPWGFSVSMLQEMIRSGEINREVEFGYMESNLTITSKFEEAFEKKVILAPYFNRESGFDVVSDFFRRFNLHIDLIDQYVNKLDLNRKMTREAAIIMLHLNAYYPTFDDNGEYIPDGARDWIIESLQLSPLAKTPLRISKQTAENIFERSKKDIEYIEENYFDGAKHFSEYYLNAKFDEFDDSLSLSMMAPKELIKYLFSCMRILSDRAIMYHEHMVQNHDERIYWIDKYNELLNHTNSGLDQADTIASPTRNE